MHDPACDDAFAKISRHTACLFHQQSPILYRGRRQGRQPLNMYILYHMRLGTKVKMVLVLWELSDSARVNGLPSRRPVAFRWIHRSLWWRAPRKRADFPQILLTFWDHRNVKWLNPNSIWLPHCGCDVGIFLGDRTWRITTKMIETRGRDCPDIWRSHRGWSCDCFWKSHRNM